ncbi:MAG: hypothetical protein JWQ04_1006 [Pedosphaera sp.]|nr:hypothetical protein [Pedosphaera sp.]
MKLNYSKDWYEQRIAREGDVEIGAGTPPGSRTPAAGKAYAKPVETRIAFGTFVELWRRNRGWDAARLAEEAGVYPAKILEIEHNPQYEPESDAVYKLARVFGISPRPLLELAGVIEPQTPSLREEAVHFAARSESVAALDERERKALDAFVSAMTESAKETA